MSVRLALALAVVLAACKGKTETPAPAPTPVAPTPDAAPPPPDAAPACLFTGTYRLRYEANGHKGWWLRFRIAGERAELLAPMDVLGVSDLGPLKLTTDQARCALTVIANGSIGEMKAELLLDPATGKVKGQMTRAKPRYPDEKLPMPVAGVREVMPRVVPPGACVRPGVYKLGFTGDKDWKGDGDCGMVYGLTKILVRVE